MKEISEGLRPGISKQPLMDSCVRAVNLGPGQSTSQPWRTDGARCTCKTLGEGALHKNTVTNRHQTHVLRVHGIRSHLDCAFVQKCCVSESRAPLCV